MIEEHHRQWIALAAVAGGAAVVTGLLLGWLSRSLGWGFGTLALPVGLAAGLVVLAFARASLAERLLAAGGATIIGIGLFAWTSHLPAWRTETAVADTELDNLCLRVTAMRICGERQIMGVFDFKDVPVEIVEEARGHVASMGAEEKQVLCDRTFGDRINAGLQAEPSGTSAGLGALWVLLTLALAAGPALLNDFRAR